MSTVHWEVWTKHFDRKYLSNPDSIISSHHNVTWCKLCECEILPWKKEEHVAEHMTELDEWLQSNKPTPKYTPRDNSSQPVDPYYSVPCAECGERIPKTGGRGRPPKLCSNCKGETK